MNNIRTIGAVIISMIILTVWQHYLYEYDITKNAISTGTQLNDIGIKLENSIPNNMAKKYTSDNDIKI